MASLVRQKIAYLLHERYLPNQFDNAQVWAGNLGIEISGRGFGADMAKVFVGPEGSKPLKAVISAELYLRGLTDEEIRLRPEDIDAQVWCDFDDRGFADEKGNHYPGFGALHPMRLQLDASGRPLRCGNNIRFVSDPVPITRTGVFHYTAEFSADASALESPAKSWLSLNEIALNDDGVVTAVPEWIRSCPSLTEVCLRKYGARLDESGGFVSGRISNLTRDLENIPTEVVYVLPFFEPGLGDLIAGEDVRKGALGSIYAIKDFFKVDPALVSDIDEADFIRLIEDELINDFDLKDLLTPRQNRRLRRVNDLQGFANRTQMIKYLGREAVEQLVGRAELRQLTRRAHELGKRVIFDLIIMQTSRDNPLINKHREWYALDEEGVPKRHRIAWLDYSDVALFDLAFNKPLQNYLSGIAPFWIKTCGFDGVRIDASQTVDTPFLKQIKNRINGVKPDALVLGETLCDMREAVRIPVDMIYSLLVDSHIHLNQSQGYLDLFAAIHSIFTPNTVAIAYFENHDSQRATRLWHWAYLDLLKSDPDPLADWKKRCAAAGFGFAGGVEQDVSYIMALLRNIQCSIINLSAGGVNGVNFCYALEMGTDWGEESPTDFENETLIYLELRDRKPHSVLHGAYLELERLRLDNRTLGAEGRVNYLREPAPGSGQQPNLLAYAKASDRDMFLVLHNLSASARTLTAPPLPFYEGSSPRLRTVYDSYALFGLEAGSLPARVDADRLRQSGFEVALEPLRSVIIKIEEAG